MHASLLAHLRSAVSSAVPLGAAAAAASATSGCCPPYVRNEVREIAALPAGWTNVEGKFLHDGGDKYFYGSPDDPDIDQDDCLALCDTAVDGCRIVLDCDGITTSGEGGTGGTGGEGSTIPDEQNRRCDPEGTGTPHQFLVLCNATYGATCGRRPPGFTDTPSPPGAGGYFATLARLEAASVHAFLTLRRELRAHGAPPSLVRSAARAAADEVRHARAMTALARRFQAIVYNPSPSASAPPRPLLDVAAEITPAPSRPLLDVAAEITPAPPRPLLDVAAEITPAPPRPLLDIAAENAREGCVRETYGAALALWQSEHAQDPEVRAAFHAVAADEIRHAALAWRVHTWARSRLSARARARLDRTLAAARRDLTRELTASPPPDLTRIAGTPTAPAAARLAAEIARRLPAASLPA